MKIQFILFVCASAVLQVYGKNISPYDLSDEAQQQIDNLKNIVQGQILSAHSDLSIGLGNFLSNSDDVTRQGQLSIQEEHQTVTNQITVLRTLSEDAGLDASQCINIPEQFINRLAVELSNGLGRCTGVVDVEASGLVRGADYLIDIEWTKVGRHEFELNRCGDQITCITTILTEVQLDEVRLPENIKKEVNAIEGLLETLDVSINQCHDINVSQYTTHAVTIVNQISTCVNDLGNDDGGDDGGSSPAPGDDDK